MRDRGPKRGAESTTPTTSNGRPRARLNRRATFPHIDFAQIINENRRRRLYLRHSDRVRQNGRRMRSVGRARIARQRAQRLQMTNGGIPLNAQAVQDNATPSHSSQLSIAAPITNTRATPAHFSELSIVLPISISNSSQTDPLPIQITTAAGTFSEMEIPEISSNAESTITINDNQIRPVESGSISSSTNSNAPSATNVNSLAMNLAERISHTLDQYFYSQPSNNQLSQESASVVNFLPSTAPTLNSNIRPSIFDQELFLLPNAYEHNFLFNTLSAGHNEYDIFDVRRLRQNTEPPNAYPQNREPTNRVSPNRILEITESNESLEFGVNLPNVGLPNTCAENPQQTQTTQTSYSVENISEKNARVDGENLEVGVNPPNQDLPNTSAENPQQTQTTQTSQSVEPISKKNASGDGKHSESDENEPDL